MSLSSFPVTPRALHLDYRTAVACTIPIVPFPTCRLLSLQPARYGQQPAKVSGGSLSSMPTEGGSQLKVMEAGVNANAAKYNEIKLTAERKTL